ncbi:MAG: SDR family NAD(P)-dependent oxidoreductase [Planctomycetota bacterium]|nr:SDR family NAD(P)-dependent oxidoreductase [Planctomycetota bacterium]
MTKLLAIVTGTSSGIGAALAKDLLSHGWTVVGIARRLISFDSDNYHHISLDLSDSKACATYFEGDFKEKYLTDDWSKIALINNAATLSPTGPLSEVSLVDLEKTFTLNIAFPAWFMGYIVSKSPAKTPLRIINISSGAATSAYPGWGSYCMSKAALRMAGQNLAIEVEEVEGLKGRDIKVLDYAPGVVDTPMQVQARSADEASFPRVQKFVDLHSNGQLVAPEAPAKEMRELLESAETEGFAIRRFGS